MLGRGAPAETGRGENLFDSPLRALIHWRVPYLATCSPFLPPSLRFLFLICSSSFSYSLVLSSSTSVLPSHPTVIRCLLFSSFIYFLSFSRSRVLHRKLPRVSSTPYSDACFLSLSLFLLAYRFIDGHSISFRVYFPPVSRARIFGKQSATVCRRVVSNACSPWLNISDRVGRKVERPTRAKPIGGFSFRPFRSKDRRRV